MKITPKRYIIILFALFSIPLFSTIPNSKSKQQRDSVFVQYYVAETDSDKMIIVRNAYRMFGKQEWTFELLDSMLAVCTRASLYSEELLTHQLRYQYYREQDNRNHLEQEFEHIKTKAKRYKTQACYDTYFTVWEKHLTDRLLEGDSEYVRLQAQAMRQEAEEYNNQVGIIKSYITLGSALKSNAIKKDSDKAIEVFNEALQLPFITLTNKISIQYRIFSIYQNHKEYDKAIEVLDTIKAIRQRQISEDTSGERSYNNQLLDDELSYCAVYSAIGDIKNLKKYLDRASQFYKEDVFYSYYMSYHNQWAKYFYQTKQWNKCLEHYDLAINRVTNATSQPFYRWAIMISKARALTAIGKDEEAVLIYRSIAFKSDSINQNILQKHEEANKANYTIKKNLLDREIRENRIREISISAMLILLIGVIILVRKLSTIRTKLNESNNKISHSYLAIETANKLKEVFLRNIINEIKKPLSKVINLSEKLYNNSEQTQEQLTEYSTEIKLNAESLLTIISNVLDLSRLESGMMKFDIQEQNLVELCNEMIMTINSSLPNEQHIVFKTDIASLSVNIDIDRFKKLLLSILNAAQIINGQNKVTLELQKESSYLQITIWNSPLSIEKGENTQIIHEINRLYLNTFLGDYEVINNEQESKIIIKYPL